MGGRTIIKGLFPDMKIGAWHGSNLADANPIPCRKSASCFGRNLELISSLRAVGEDSVCRDAGSQEFH